jgi:hypothetical protein
MPDVAEFFSPEVIAWVESFTGINLQPADQPSAARTQGTSNPGAPANITFQSPTRADSLSPAVDDSCDAPNAFSPESGRCVGPPTLDIQFFPPEPDERDELARHPALARVPEDQRFLAATVPSPYGELVFIRANASDEADKKKTVEAGLAALDAGARAYTALLGRADKQKALVQPFQPYLEQPKDLIPILRDAYENPHVKTDVDKAASRTAVLEAQAADQQKQLAQNITSQVKVVGILAETQRQALAHALAEKEIQDTDEEVEKYKEKLEKEEKKSESEWEAFEGAEQATASLASENPSEGLAGAIKLAHALFLYASATTKDSKLGELQDKASELKLTLVVKDINDAIDGLGKLSGAVNDLLPQVRDAEAKLNEHMAQAEDWFDEDCAKFNADQTGDHKDNCDFNFKALREAIKTVTETAGQARRLSEDLQATGSLGGPVDRMVSVLRALNEIEIRTVGSDIAGWFDLCERLEEMETQLNNLRQVADTELTHAPGKR